MVIDMNKSNLKLFLKNYDFRFGLVGVIVGEICSNLGFFTIENVTYVSQQFVFLLGGCLLVIGGLYIGIAFSYWSKAIIETKLFDSNTMVTQ